MKKTDHTPKAEYNRLLQNAREHLASDEVVQAGRLQAVRGCQGRSPGFSQNDQWQTVQNPG